MYIFISHSSTNAKLAEAICSKIEKNGHECFLAPRNIRLGHEYASEIVMGIDNSNAMLLILSKEAINSPHVLREIERAVSKSIPIIVYKLEEVELTKSMEYFLMTHQWITNPIGNYEDVINCINCLVESSPSIGPVATKKPSRRKYILPVVIVLSAIIIAGAIIAGTFIIKDSHKNEESTPVTEHNETTNTEETTTSKPKEVLVGSTITLGKYNNAPIEWRVIKISDDGKSAILIAQNILTIKGFDAAESGKNGYCEGIFQNGHDLEDLTTQKIAFGDNTWATSSLRDWLNSTSEVVTYTGHAPTAQAFTDRTNSYETEPGFLFGFKKEELDLILDTTISTLGNPHSDTEYIETTDKVFLLSTEELSWFEGTDIPLYAIPTKDALIQNTDSSYKEIIQDSYHTDSLYWWLRDPAKDSTCKVNYVSLSVKPDVYESSFFVSVPSIGVRPAITVDLTSDRLNIK